MGEIVRRMVSKYEMDGTILKNSAQSNILFLNSTCNVWCKFCSHHQNPPEVETYRIPAVSLDLADQAISLMDPHKPVVIGESVTRVMEGEPFIHPEIKLILTRVREKMPGTPVRITTNGTMLDREMVEFLASLGGVTIYLSLNSADPSVRRLLMQDSRADIAIESAALMRQWSLPYHGSIVAVPHVSGWNDLAATIKFFDFHGAQTVRVFMPGHTRLAPALLRVPGNLRDQLHFFLDGIRREISVPVTLEPPLVRDLKASVTGVVAGSPAARAGLAAGDIIEKVNGRKTKSRVDAFQKVLEGKNPSLEVIRPGKRLSVTVVKEKGWPSGLVFDYDMDPSTVREIEAAVRRRGAQRAVLVASELGFGAVRLALEKMWEDSAEVVPVMAKNRFFGGSIGCAGLLTVGDLLEVAEEYRCQADLLIVPGIAFDGRGRDITGRSYLDLELKKGPLVEVI